MGWRSSVLIVVLAFGILFSFMYASSLHYTQPHDPRLIYTNPMITQLQAIEIIEQDLGKQVLGFSEAYAHFYYYNFSNQEYERDRDYQQYRKKTCT